MQINYREMLGMPTLKTLLGVSDLKSGLNQKQKKAVRNIKYCANDQWGYVNGWYDEHDQGYRDFMLSPEKLFNTIYRESLDAIYDEGAVCFGKAAEMWLKDIRFCGKSFLQKVAFYFTAKLLEDAVPEVDATEEDAANVARELERLKAIVCA